MKIDVNWGLLRAIGFWVIAGFVIDPLGIWFACTTSLGIHMTILQAYALWIGFLLAVVTLLVIIHLVIWSFGSDDDSTKPKKTMWRQY